LFSICGRLYEFLPTAKAIQRSLHPADDAIEEFPGKLRAALTVEVEGSVQLILRSFGEWQIIM
jgi:hypothetical protein